MKGLNLPAPLPAFARRKARILEQLAVPEAEYADASPKGSVDEGIRDLIDEVNRLDGFVTTSSCAGRVSVFLEGSKRAGGAGFNGEGGGSRENGDEGDEGVGGEVRKFAGVGGKGGGGNWLFVSHDPVPLDAEAKRDLEALLGLRIGAQGEGNEQGDVPRGDFIHDVATTRLVHFKFEPMILHVLTASPEHAQLLLRCGLQAGFRESGAVSLTVTVGEQHATPIVAIRSMGLMFESLIGYYSGDGEDGKLRCTVSSTYLQTLVQIANERFSENKKRIERFRSALTEATTPSKNGEEWEDAQVRRERKRAEGLKRREELRKQKQDSDDIDVGDATLDVPLNTDLT
ncbi:methyltransferase TYW3-domain-containing protein [Hypomontagnella monticulosa]|nr:methyltransferase TYW3-domain-containing protein [Hypomontagnella monticulosa]